MKRLPAFAVLFAAIGLAAAGCHQSGPPSAPPPNMTQTPPTPAVTVPDKIVVYALNPKATGDDDLLVPRTVALEHPKEPARDAVAALVNSAYSPITRGTVLRGLSVDNGLATLDFSQNPVNETGGEGAQSAALNALAMTLGQFPSISTYRIQVKGRPEKSFGEFAADGPMEVIRPGKHSKLEGSGQ